MILYLFIALFFFTSCQHSPIGQSQDMIIVDSIRKETNWNFAKKGFVRLGRTEAYDPITSRIREFYQTRKMRFQSIETLRPFFKAFFQEYSKPFTDDKRLPKVSTENIELEITFLDEMANPLPSPQVAKVKNSGGKIFYYTFDEKAKSYILLNEETF